ncbi:MAG: hypothetical protein CMG74_08890 [Candidatus Marinimicrobia bacterium]|nr:hypothetical protein [Candidatus Neomarinimicrobiota bacterium]
MVCTEYKSKYFNHINNFSAYKYVLINASFSNIQIIEISWLNFPTLKGKIYSDIANKIHKNRRLSIT